MILHRPKYGQYFSFPYTFGPKNFLEEKCIIRIAQKTRAQKTRAQKTRAQKTRAQKTRAQSECSQWNKSEGKRKVKSRVKVHCRNISWRIKSERKRYSDEVHDDDDDDEEDEDHDDDDDDDDEEDEKRRWGRRWNRRSS